MILMLSISALSPPPFCDLLSPLSVTYKNWDVDPRKTSRNGKDCLVMGYKGTEKWSLFYCKEESSFICEKKGVCPTVVGAGTIAGFIIDVAAVYGSTIAAIIFGPRLYRSI
ncbi:hypothetical protein PoB_002555700 [Plakobranchus ocellatus]|uniref:C-type lectin domain-containing protein n=1 Tax=Plakobranchus ocellatus TaxID=259542 RepID=A0AAV3ZWW5_9GAST|nr:hypothetical protein PoB_002555700 [Plakobranchus ocellatus]